MIEYRPFELYGELFSDGHTIRLAATGDARMASQALALLTPHCDKVYDGHGDLSVALSWTVCCQLAGVFGPLWHPGPRLLAWIRAEITRRTVAPTDLATAELAPDLPADKTPRDYQVRGALLTAMTGHPLFFDDMGTGKTLTATLGVLELRARGFLPLAGPIVVVAPPSAVDGWVRTVSEWTTLRAVAYRGPQRRRLIGQAEFYVTTYGHAADLDSPKRGKAATYDANGPLGKLRPAAVVIDELHWLKNPDSHRSRLVRRLCHRPSVQAVLALSGTPITHGPVDLWPTLNALEPTAWPSRERFESRYVLSADTEYGHVSLGLNPATQDEFYRALTGQWRRLAKADVLDQLPPKVYQQRTVTMPAAARKAYEQMERDMFAELDEGQRLESMSALAQLTRLRQLALSACDVEQEHSEVEVDEFGEPKIITHVTLKEPSWVVDEVMTILAERHAATPDKPTGFASDSVQLAVLVGKRAEKAGYRVGYVIGGQTAQDRTAQIEAFQAGELDLICVSRAGREGITLTAADCVIFASRPWSYNDSAQMEDRFHRLGSERHDSVTIVDIIVANTVDTYVRQVLRRKAGAMSQLLQDPRIYAECLGGGARNLERAS